MSVFKFIRLDKLRPPEFDAHQTPNEAADNELAESIRTHGILEPLLVRDTSTGLEIIFGKRRFRMAQRVGLSAAPCMITKATDSEAETFKIHENIKRLPMGHVDQSLTFQHLRVKFKMTEQQISTLVGKSIAYVSQHLSLLQSEPVLVESVRDGRLNFSIARELMQIDDKEELQRLLRYARDEGATAETVHLWVMQYKHDKALEGPTVVDESITAPPSSPREYLVVCEMCEQTTRIIDIKIIRACIACHKIVFDAIFARKTEIPVNPSPQTSTDSADGPPDP